MRTVFNSIFITIIVLLSIFSLASAQNEGSAEAVISPDTILFIYTQSVDQPTGYINIGNFQAPYSASDIDLNAFVINDQYQPEFAMVVPFHPAFNGKVIRIGIYLRDFINTYPIWWDTTQLTYSVRGQYTDGSSFSVEGMFTAIGHISGDANADGKINVADAVFLINYVFKSGPQPPFPSERGDANGDGHINIGDIGYLIYYIYHNGPPPVKHH